MEVFERVARAAVSEASAMLRATWRDAKTIRHKGAVDIVTETDHAIEAGGHRSAHRGAFRII